MNIVTQNNYEQRIQLEGQNLQQQLELELGQSSSLPSPAFTEDVVVILQQRVSVCGAGDINKHLNTKE